MVDGNWTGAFTHHGSSASWGYPGGGGTPSRSLTFALIVNKPLFNMLLIYSQHIKLLTTACVLLPILHHRPAGAYVKVKVLYLQSEGDHEKHTSRHCRGCNLGVCRNFGFCRGHHVASTDIRACRLAFLRSEEHTSELQSLMRISYAV